jgi:CheY-like chemotaxis protein
MEEATERDLAAEASRGTRGAILVVDDDQAIRTLLSHLLSTMGFRVTQAGGGDEALDLFSKESFEVVLTDFQMPGMDGFALASHIKSSSPETPVIMITGSAESVVQEKMRKGCVDSVLFKPFRLEDILKSVKGALTGGFACYATDQYFGEAQRGV